MASKWNGQYTSVTGPSGSRAPNAPSSTRSPSSSSFGSTYTNDFSSAQAQQNAAQIAAANLAAQRAAEAAAAKKAADALAAKKLAERMAQVSAQTMDSTAKRAGSVDKTGKVIDSTAYKKYQQAVKDNEDYLKQYGVRKSYLTSPGNYGDNSLRTSSELQWIAMKEANGTATPQELAELNYIRDAAQKTGDQQLLDYLEAGGVNQSNALASANALLAQLMNQPQLTAPVYKGYESNYPDMQGQLQSIANNPISTGGDIVNPTVDFLSLWSGNETAQADQANRDYATQVGAITDVGNAQTNRNNTIADLMNEIFNNEYQTGTLDYNKELLQFNKQQEEQDVKEWNVKAALQKIDRGIANEDDYRILNIALNTPALAQIISQWQMDNGLMPDTPAYGY